MFGNLQAARSAQTQTSNQKRKAPRYQSEVWGLIDEESIVVRFSGGAAEPHIFQQHGLARHPQFGFEKAVCCKPTPCEACVAASVRGEKRVKKPSPYAAFTVYSSRQLSLIPYTRQDGTTGVRRQPLRQNSSGTYIAKCPNTKVVRPVQDSDLENLREWDTEDEGLKSWCGSLSLKANNAAKLLQLDEQLQSKCQCGQRVGTGLGARPAEIEVIEGNLRCTSGCDNPSRGGLTSCYVQITRRGVGTDTTYDFSPLPFSAPEPDHEMGNLSLAELYAPDPEGMQDQLHARGVHVPTADSAQGNIWEEPSSSFGNLGSF
jgi:hypothetical protein